MSTVQKVNQDDVKKIIKSGVTLVKFGAPWCIPCRMLDPILDDLLKETSVCILDINTDENTELAQEYNIRSVPTVIIFKDNKMQDISIGLQSKEYYIDKLKVIEGQ